MRQLFILLLNVLWFSLSFGQEYKSESQTAAKLSLIPPGFFISGPDAGKIGQILDATEAYKQHLSNGVPEDGTIVFKMTDDDTRLPILYDAVVLAEKDGTRAYVVPPSEMHVNGEGLLKIRVPNGRVYTVTMYSAAYLPMFYELNLTQQFSGNEYYTSRIIGGRYQDYWQKYHDRATLNSVLGGKRGPVGVVSAGGKPLPGAKVFALSNPGIFAMTDENGEYALPVPEDGAVALYEDKWNQLSQFDLVIEKEGFNRLERRINIDDIASFSLTEPVPSPLPHVTERPYSRYVEVPLSEIQTLVNPRENAAVQFPTSITVGFFEGTCSQTSCNTTILSLSDPDNTSGFNLKACRNCSGTNVNQEYPLCNITLTLPFKNYLKHVLPAEWPSGWLTNLNDYVSGKSEESFRAAVAAITSYALVEYNDGLEDKTTNGQGYHISTSTCHQAFRNSVVATDNIVNQQDGWYLISGSGSPVKTEYAAENNDINGTPNAPPMGSYPYWGQCGDGHFQKSISGPPLNDGACFPIESGVYDVVSMGKYDSKSHPRGMSQRGSLRWATGREVTSGNDVLLNQSVLPANYNGWTYQTKNWRQILAWYYPYLKLKNDNTGEVISLSYADYPAPHTSYYQQGASPNCSDQGEPNDAFPQANTLSYNGSAWGTVNQTATLNACLNHSGTPDQDYFKIVVPVNGKFQVKCVAGKTLKMQLLNVNQKVIVEKTGSTMEDFVCITAISPLWCTPFDRFWIKVYETNPASNTSTPYTLTLSWFPNAACSTHELSWTDDDIAAAKLLFDFTGSSSVCTNQSNSWTVSGGNPPYTWVVDGALAGSGPTLSYTFSAPGNHNISVRDADCMFKEKTVAVKSTPVAHAVCTTPLPIAAGEEAVLQGSGGGSYLWSPGNHSGWSYTVAPNQSTTYTLTVTASNGCTDTDQIAVTVEGNTGGGGSNAPANDNPCGAFEVVTGSSCQPAFGYNTGATTTTSPPVVSCDGASQGDVWFKVKVPASGKIVIDIQPVSGSPINDMGMAVYTGSSCSNLSYYGCYANGSNSTAQGWMPYAYLTGLTPGAWLWLRLYEYNNNQFGGFKVCAIDPGGGPGGGGSAQPDLIVYSLIELDGKYSVDQGDYINIRTKIKCLSAPFTGSGILRVWLSTDLVPGNSGDKFLFEKNFAAYNVDEIKQYTQNNVQVPSVPDGVYYILAHIDPSSGVENESEGNVMGKTIEVGNIPEDVDLTVDIEDVSATFGVDYAPGVKITMQVEGQNETDSELPTSPHYAVYLQQGTGDFGEEITYFLGDGLFWKPDLNGGGSDQNTRHFYLPNNLPSAGWYTLWVHIDSENEVPESDEENNWDSRQIYISTTMPAGFDLSIAPLGFQQQNAQGDWVDVPWNAIDVGKELMIRCNMTNTGNAVSPSGIRNYYFISNDPILSSDDKFFAAGNLNSLDPGESEERSEHDPVAKGGGLGLNYAIIVANLAEHSLSYDYVPEGNMSNNMIVMPFWVSPGNKHFPDFSCQLLSVNPSALGRGDTLVGTVKVSNLGDTAAVVPVDIFISEDPVFDQYWSLNDEDPSVGSLQGGSVNLNVLLQPGKDTVLTFTAIARGINEPGPQYLLAMVDFYKTSIELNENNNISTLPLTITNTGCYALLFYEQNGAFKDTVDYQAQGGFVKTVTESEPPCPWTLCDDANWTPETCKSGSGIGVQYWPFPENPSVYPRTLRIYSNYGDTLKIVQRGKPCGAGSATPQVNITLAAAPSACGGTAKFVAQYGGVAGATLRWSVNGIIKAQGLNLDTFSVPVTSSQTITISATLSDPCGQSASSLNFTPSSLSGVYDVILFTDEPSCAGAGSITAIPVDASGATYHWSTGAATAQIGNVWGGVYTVTVTDAGGCTVVKSVSVAAPDTVIAGVQWEFIPAYCDGDTTPVVLARAAGAGSDTLNYFWEFGDASSFSNEILLRRDVPNVLHVQAWDQFGCTTGRDTTLPALKPSAISNFHYNLSGCAGDVAAEITLGTTGSGAVSVFSPQTVFFEGNLNGGNSTLTVAPVSGASVYIAFTDPNGCTSIDSMDIAQPPALLLSVDSIVVDSCPAYFLAASGGVPPYSGLNWQNGADTLFSPLPNSYTGTVADAWGCQAEVKLDIAAPCAASGAPAAIFSFENIGCTNIQVRFINTSKNADAYLWNFGDGSTGTEPNPVHLYAVPGTYAVTLTATNTFTGLSTSSVQTITAVITVAVASISPSGSVSICEGSAKVLQANGAAGYAYQWYRNSVALPNATNQSYSAHLWGYYTVRVTNPAGCTANSAPTAITTTPVPSVSASAQGSPEICPGGSVTLLAASPPVNTFQWLLDGAIIPGATKNSWSATAPGNYTVVVTNGYGCTAASVPISVALLPAPAVSLGNDVTLPAGQALTLNAGAGYTAYQWSTGDATQTIVVAQAGTYSVTVTGANGCTGSDEILVNFSTVGTGSPAEETFDVKAYPNPVTGILRITIVKMGGRAESVHIVLSNSLGQLVASRKTAMAGTESAFELDMTALPGGTYALQVAIDRKTVRTVVIKI